MTASAEREIEHRCPGETCTRRESAPRAAMWGDDAPTLTGRRRLLAEDDDTLGGSLWWVGAIIYTFGSVIINLGSNLIRLNHDQLSKIPEDLHPPIYKRWTWLFGACTAIT